MSDIPNGPGWWQASDGKWYPPEQHPSAQAPPPPSGLPHGTPVPGGQQPPSNLAWAILSTLFCCLPLGIVSIVKASRVSSLWSSGRFADAEQASADARKWALISAGLGVAIYVWAVAITLGGDPGPG